MSITGQSEAQMHAIYILGPRLCLELCQFQGRERKDIVIHVSYTLPRNDIYHFHLDFIGQSQS